MLELSRREPRIPAYPPQRESQMLEPMVDILIGDYYHPELAKKSQGVLKSGMIAAVDGWSFNSRGQNV